MKSGNPTSQALLENSESWAAPGLPFLPVPEAAAQLALYQDMLIHWNKALNLSGCQDAFSFLRDLVQDSFFLVRFLEDLFSQRAWASPSTADLGAGAGLPSIPLRIFWRQGEFALVERRQKRALFLANVLARLNLFQTSAHCCDARDFLASRAPFQCILSRAFMPWREMLSFAAPWLAPDGFIVFMASRQPPESVPGWKLEASLEYLLPQKRRLLWAFTPAMERTV